MISFFFCSSNAASYFAVASSINEFASSLISVFKVTAFSAVFIASS